MNIFEQKYGIAENKKVEDFHCSRRMFCVYNGKLQIADQNLPYSHATWFEKEGWMSKEDDELMNKIVRGIVDSQGNVYFYTGYDFKVNSDVENTFFPHLKELTEKLGLDSGAKVFGGLVKSEPGEIWPPANEYGDVQSNLE
jgi:hypothetical protein